ncbi:NfeD family protein [Halococcus thailandensis]|uniref:Membrane protease regulatory membrane protein n=1 Tax=Halococcus thailandensis JCM 13552 TaxID=1227457 RepID=M0N8D9_9EURY|nr:membrane protease regulatory membrane protein [Halococcus thailandensis]EMA54126.1 membrane protease regulatory membrane protein [Halococcus thailandensis JCM 13552]
MTLALGGAPVAAALPVLQMSDLLLEQLPLVLVVAGLGLMGAEALAPGAHFIVLGVALLFAGLIGLLIGSFLGPIVLAVVLSVLVLASGAGTLYAYHRFDIYGGKGAGKTSDSASLRGTTGHVTERVTPTNGKVKLDGGGFNPNYSARTLDGEIPEDEPIMVTDPGGGNVLTVEALSAVEDDIDRALARGRDTDDRERETA